MEKFYLFRVFTYICAFFLLGVAVFSLWPIKNNLILSLIIITLLLLCSLINYLLKNKLLFLLSLCLCFFMLGITYYSSFQSKKFVNIPAGKIKIEGQVINKPELDYKSQTVLVKAYRVDHPKDQFIVHAKLARFPNFHYGDGLVVEGNFSPLGSLPYSMQRSLKAKNALGQIRDVSSIEIISFKLGTRERAQKILYNFSDGVSDIFVKTLPEPDASLAIGIILGSKKSFPQEFMDQLSATGTTHIIALSGYNVTIITGMLFGFLVCYIDRRKTFFIVMLLLILFVLMTGAMASAVRAAIFSVLLLIGHLKGRRADFPNLLVFTALLMVLENPNVLFFDLGFELSFLAFLGIIYLSPLMRIIIEKKPFIFLPSWVKGTLGETLSAQTAVFPLILAVFGRISLIAPITNVLILWVIPYAMLCAGIVGISGLIFLPAAKILSFLFWPLFHYVIFIIERFSKIPFAMISLNFSNSYFLPLSYGLLIMAVIVLFKKYNFKTSL